MASILSRWFPHRLTLPQQHTGQVWDQIRYNLFALAVADAHGLPRGWNYTNSVTRAEASPGTAAQPARKYWYRGTGNSRQWVKVVCTYTGADLTKMALYWSEDNEASYVPMFDEDGINYVLTLTYTLSVLQTSTWGNVP